MIIYGGVPWRHHKKTTQEGPGHTQRRQPTKVERRMRTGKFHMKSAAWRSRSRRSVVYAHRPLSTPCRGEGPEWAPRSRKPYISGPEILRFLKLFFKKTTTACVNHEIQCATVIHSCRVF